MQLNCFPQLLKLYKTIIILTNHVCFSMIGRSLNDLLSKTVIIYFIFRQIKYANILKALGKGAQSTHGVYKQCPKANKRKRETTTNHNMIQAQKDIKTPDGLSCLQTKSNYCNPIESLDKNSNFIYPLLSIPPTLATP